MHMPKSSRRQRKPIPRFRSEQEEREFWETHDTTDYVDWSQGRIIRFPNLKPSTTTISLRLPTPLLADLKALANKRDVSYQSLLKVFVAERVAAEQQLPNKRLQRTVGRRRLVAPWCARGVAPQTRPPAFSRPARASRTRRRRDRSSSRRPASSAGVKGARGGSPSAACWSPACPAWLRCRSVPPRRGFPPSGTPKGRSARWALPRSSCTPPTATSWGQSKHSSSPTYSTIRTATRPRASLVRTGATPSSCSPDPRWLRRTRRRAVRLNRPRAARPRHRARGAPPARTRTPAACAAPSPA